VESKEELLDILSCTLRALYPNLLRCELNVIDESGNSFTSSFGAAPGGTSVERPELRLLRDVCANGHFVPARTGVNRGSLMSAPLFEGRASAGLIVVEAVAGKSFSDAELEILESVAGVFSLAFQRLHSKRTEHLRASIEFDRRAARSVQRRLMGDSLPADIGVKVDARYLPALDVGGDFYELAYVGDGRICGAIGDVSGKGVSAALIMSRVSSDIGRALRSGASPSKVLERVNATLTDVESETFVTASCINLDVRRCRLTVANAGHLPLMVRRANGEVFDFGPASGTPLGMMPCPYIDECLALQPLDIVVLMTDGLVEALDRPGDPMGMALLHHLVKSAPHDPKIINAHIIEAANEMEGRRPLDDMTLVALQLEAP
jgi:serine phosphatase RsbU (regulator of sigma subunit)